MKISKSALAGLLSIFTLTLGMIVMISCGAADTTEETSSDGATTLSWETDINPIVEASCGGTSCHGAGASNTVYVDQEAVFKAASTSITDRLGRSATAAGYMPEGTTITSANKNALLDFLAQ